MKPAAKWRVDRSLWLTAAVVVVLLLVPKLFQHAGAHTGDLDTGNYSNLAWAILHGEGFSGSVLGRHHLGEHFSPVMVLIAPIYLVWQSAYALMILQALAVAATIVLVLHLADRQMRAAGFDDDGGAGQAAAARIRFIAGATLLVMFLFYPPLLATWRTQFQAIELGMPLVALAILLLHAGKTRWLAVVVLLLLSTRESAPLAVAGLAIYAGFALNDRTTARPTPGAERSEAPDPPRADQRTIRRDAPRRWRLAIVLGITAALWAGLTMGLIMPYFRAHYSDVGRWSHVRWLEPGAMWGMKARYLAIMLLGLGPLPFLGRRALIATAAALPGIFLNLAVSRETQVSFIGHYDAQTAPFLMVAAAHGAVTLATWARRRRHSDDRGDARGDGRRENRGADPAMIRSFAIIAGASLVTCFICFGVAGSRGPFQQVKRWFPTKDRLALVRETRRAGQEFADAPALAAWSILGPQVCHRPHYMALRCGTSQSSWRAWASSRLLPGTIILIPTEAFSEECGERPLLRGSGRAELVYRGRMIEAWRWPIDAPAPGTNEARAYVANASAATTRPAPSPRRPVRNRKRRGEAASTESIMPVARRAP